VYILVWIRKKRGFLSLLHQDARLHPSPYILAHGQDARPRVHLRILAAITAGAPWGMGRVWVRGGTSRAAGPLVTVTRPRCECGIRLRLIRLTRLAGWQPPVPPVPHLALDDVQRIRGVVDLTAAEPGIL